MRQEGLNVFTCMQNYETNEGNVIKCTKTDDFWYRYMTCRYHCTQMDVNLLFQSCAYESTYGVKGTCDSKMFKRVSCLAAMLYNRQMQMPVHTCMYAACP